MTDLVHGDGRWTKFQQEYTTNEHLMTLYDGIKAHAAINARGWDMMDQRLGGIDSSISNLGFATEQGFAILADQLGSLEQAVTDGFRGMQETFTWGIARICWEHEQDRQVYRDILAAMLRKHQTDSLAYRQDGEKATQNEWWDEAVTDLSKATELYRYDYLAHLQLARVLWFQKHEWEAALEHFELAAKYADTVDADADQRYYAAVGYSHASLLWRLDAETNQANRAASMEKALAASSRASALAGTLAVALQEHVLNLLKSVEAGTARRVMDEAVTKDDKLLVFLETSPDLAGFDVVRKFVEDWRGSRSTVLRDATDIAGVAERLLTEYSLDATRSRQARSLLTANTGGSGATPVSALGEAMPLVRADLTAGEETLKTQVQLVRAQGDEGTLRRQMNECRRVMESQPRLPEWKSFSGWAKEAAGMGGDMAIAGGWEGLGCGLLFLPISLLLLLAELVYLPFKRAKYDAECEKARSEHREKQERAARNLRDLELKAQRSAEAVTEVEQRHASFAVKAAGLEGRMRELSP